MVTSKIRGRNWTSEELELFAEVLVDEKNQFAFSLERLALKKSANSEVFVHIKNNFDHERNDETFIKINEFKNFTNDKGQLEAYVELGTAVEKLRRKYNTMKSDWRKISDKKCNGLPPEKEPNWYPVLNPVFSEINETLSLSNCCADMSFQLEVNKVDVKTENFAEEEVDKDKDDSNNIKEREDIASFIDNTECATNKTNLNKSPQRKRKFNRSKNHELSRLAKAMEELAASQIKRTKLMIEADKKRDEIFLKNKNEEAERNRQHELRLAQIYASAISTFSSTHRSSDSCDDYTLPINCVTDDLSPVTPTLNSPQETTLSVPAP